MSGAAKRVALCADDFGQSAAADQGILRLVAARRLTAVSCLAQGPSWGADAPALFSRAAAVDAGLHLDLTDGSGGVPPTSLASLIVRSYARRLDAGEVERRLAAQLDAFERTAGRPPAFVDGHRHVHQLPMVRGALLGVLRARYGRAMPFVRCTVSRRARGAKALAVATLGGLALRRALLAGGVPHNRDFAGIYDFDPAADYPGLMRRWLEGVEDGGLILCHPGLSGGAPEDPIAAARAAELRYLESEAFPEACSRAGVRLVRLAELVRPW